MPASIAVRVKVNDPVSRMLASDAIMPHLPKEYELLGVELLVDEC